MPKDGFKQVKLKWGWTTGSLGASQLEDKEYSYAAALYKGVWPKKNHYIPCARFYSFATKHVLKSGPHTGKTLFENLNEVFNKKADLTSDLVAQLQPRLFVTADNLYTKLKHEENGPESIVDILLCMLPTLEPLGKSPLTPNGVNGDNLK